MTYDQTLLDIFNGLRALQLQALELFQAISENNKETSWEIWSKYHIPNLLQLVAICAGILIVRHQIQKQHESTLQTQDEKIRVDLKLQLRADIEKHIDALNELTSAAVIFPLMLSNSLVIARADIQSGIIPRPIPQRIPKFNQDNHNIAIAAIEIITTVEKYEIAMPELKIFQMAMCVFQSEFNDASKDYMLALLNFLPIDAPAGLINRPLPTPQQEEHLKILGKKYSDVLHDVGGWVMDLRTAVQTLALGKLFPNNKIGIRQPIDPKVIVIKTDAESIAQLTRYFENSTTWGRSKRAAEDTARQQQIG
jgi:hypothetical protein